jgi:hypothetical protein
MNDRFCHNAAAISLAIVAATAGCRNANELDTAPVSGRVVLNGKPLSRGSVTFVPNRGRVANGDIQPDGTFELSTYRSGDGAIVGSHKAAVLILRPDIDPAVGPERDKPLMLIPPRYATAEESGLKYEVKAGQNNDFTLELHDP